MVNFFFCRVSYSLYFDYTILLGVILLNVILQNDAQQNDT